MQELFVQRTGVQALHRLDDELQFAARLVDAESAAHLDLLTVAGFEVQQRPGTAARPFRLVKFRTMTDERDARGDLLPDDHRLTQVGRVVRSLSLDELPQLWNVLTGDMSIVGPRPMMPSQKSIYPGTEYYQMRPGITGFWQISVRNESNFAERAQFDRRYFGLISLRTDLSVMLRTFGAVFRATGS